MPNWPKHHKWLHPSISNLIVSLLFHHLGTSSLQSHGTGPCTKCFLHLFLSFFLSLSHLFKFYVQTHNCPLCWIGYGDLEGQKRTMYPAPFHYINNFGEWLWCAMNKMGTRWEFTWSNMRMSCEQEHYGNTIGMHGKHHRNMVTSCFQYDLIFSFGRL